MSRTFVHAPWHAKMRDPRWRTHFRESHDHTAGPCDLERFDPRALWSATHCHLVPVNVGRDVHCGCHLCTGQDERRVERRRDRQQARRQLRDCRKLSAL